MKVDDHPEYKKGVEAPKEKLKTDRDGYRAHRRMQMLLEKDCLQKQEQREQK